MRAAPPDRRRYRQRLALLVVLVIAGLIGHGTFAGSGDEPHYQMIAQSIAFDGDLDLSNNYADTGNVVFGGELKPEGHAIAASAGVLRPVHDVGLPLLFAPYFALSYRVAELTERLPESWLRKAKITQYIVLRHLLSLAMSAFAAWIALSLFDRFAVGSTFGKAFGWAALLTLSPPLLSHAFLFFPDVVSAAVVLYVFDWLTRPDPRRAPPLLVGLSAGALFLLHTRNAGLVVAFAGLVLWHGWRDPRQRERAAWFLVGLIGAVAARSALIYYMWGTFVTTPHARAVMPEGFQLMTRELATRTIGWMVDQEHGLLPYAPIYLLMPVGWLALWRANRSLCVHITVVVGLYVTTIALPFVNPHGWRGGWSPAARYLVPVVPLLAILVFSAVQTAWRTPIWVRALVVLQVALDAVWWQYPKLLWNDGEGVSRMLLALGSGTNRLAGLLPSLAEPVALRTVWLGLAFAGCWLAWSVWAARMLAKEASAITPSGNRSSGTLR